MSEIHGLVVVIALCAHFLAFVGVLLVREWRLLRDTGVFKLPKSTRFILVVSFACATIQAQKTRYCHVDAAAKEGGDGSEGHPFKDIQEAIDYVALQTNRYDVVVMPGVYGPVAIGRTLVNVRSSTNAGVCVIDGRGGMWAANADGDVKPILEGFVVQNATNGVAGFEMRTCTVFDFRQIGVSNCIVASSSVVGGSADAREDAGSIAECGQIGVTYSSLYDSVITSCGRGAALSILTNCTVTGSTEFGIVDSSATLSYITNNYCCAVSNCTVDTCLVAGNDVGIVDGFVTGSTVAANRFCGAMGNVALCNTVLAYNKDGTDRLLNFSGESIFMTNCCTSPMPPLGAYNVECGLPIHPRTYRLRPMSPAIGAGNTSLLRSTRDLSGRFRIYDGDMDIGAFRYYCNLIADCTSKSPIPVPYAWLKDKLRASYNDKKGKGEITAWEDNGSYVRFNYEQYYDGILHLEYARVSCETMAQYTSEKKWSDGSPMTWWQEYLTGTEPNNPNDFLTAGIAVTNNIPYLSWLPNLGKERLYLIMGARSLQSEWELVDDLKFTGCKFFKISVDMP